MVGIFSVTFALFCLEDMRVFFSAKHRKRKVKKYSAYACRAFTGGRKGIYGANQICGTESQGNFFPARMNVCSKFDAVHKRLLFDYLAHP